MQTFSRKLNRMYAAQLSVGNAVIGSKPIFDKENGNGFVGCAITLKENGQKRIVFNDNKGVLHTGKIID